MYVVPFYTQLVTYVEVEAASVNEAYEKACDVSLPSDTRVPVGSEVDWEIDFENIQEVY